MSSGKPPTVSMETFSSTAKLADYGPSSNEKDELYNPFDHRQVDKPNTSLGSLAHLLKSSLGTGILAMPMAFKNSGIIFGAVGTLVIGFICTHCVHILVRTSHDVCKKTKTPSLGFSETAEAVFGSAPHPRIRALSGFAKQFVDYALMATYIGSNCVYIVFIAESMKVVVDFYTSQCNELRIFIAIVVIPLLFLGQIRNLKYLVPFSAMANIFIVIVFSITLYYMFETVEDITQRDYFTSFEQLPLYFSTVIFAMEGIGVIMPVENQMKRPQDFLGCPGVLNIAMITVVTLYSVIGFFGYLRFGDEIKGAITLNLDINQIPSQISQILIGLAILFTYGLQFYVPMDILFRKLDDKIPKEKNNMYQIIIRSGIIIASGGVAAAVPKLDPFIGLVGSIFFSLLGLLVPAVIETIFRWDGNLGPLKWVLWKNLILIVFALFALVAGTIVSVEGIIGIYTENEGEEACAYH